MMRVEAQPAYVLHTRNYRENCLLVDVLAEDYGRLTLLAKGARKLSGKAKQNTGHLLQLFTPLMLSWLGKGNLKTLTAVERRSWSLQFHEKRLYSAFYMNELLTILLSKDDTSVGFYDLYAKAITQLANDDDIESVLRRFEFTLLERLGYGIDFYTEANSGEQLSIQGCYRFVANLGFVSADVSQSTAAPLVSGKTIQAIANNDWQDRQVRHSAKVIARAALKPYLNGKLLKSRELFQ